MLNKKLNPKHLNETYVVGDPFPHIVLDNFLDSEIASSVAEEIKKQDLSSWDHDQHSEQLNKWFMSNIMRLPQFTAKTLQWFNSGEALSFFQNLTGIDGLIADPTYLGGGVHVSTAGGKLGIHSDFNLHPTYGIHRRLNALLFLNSDWQSSWNGQLEFWTPDMKMCSKSIEPIFNRLVIFNVNDKSFHGVPKMIACPSDKKRISLALYYYTLDRPENEKSQFHWALWQKPNLNS